MMISDRGNNGRLDIGRIDIPDFEVSWAGSLPPSWGPGYCFGSDDGRVQFTGPFTSVGVPDEAGPYRVAPSGDAINGIAFAGDLIAASTRSEIVILNIPREGKGPIKSAVYHGGAHGVISTQGGSIVAPMGRRGILLLRQDQADQPRVKVLKPADEALNVYRVASLASPVGGEILACAAQGSGFAAIPLTDAGHGFGRILRPAGVSFIDVAALGVDGHPAAVAALGLDGSIHLVGDLMGDRTSRILRYPEIRGRAYRLLCAEGHVFLLTSRRLYIFVDLAARFLAGEAIDGPEVVPGWDLEAVDVSLALDRSLLIVMPETLYRITIDQLIAGGGNRAGDSRPLPQISVELPTHSTDLGNEIWESFNKSPWKSSDELHIILT